jgi:hypothetical protein
MITTTPVASPGDSNMNDLTAEQLLAQESFEEDVRELPDNVRRGRFRAGWEDFTVRERRYAPESLTQLTWTNLGYRLGVRFGLRSREEMDDLYEKFATQYQTTK